MKIKWGACNTKKKEKPNLKYALAVAVVRLNCEDVNFAMKKMLTPLTGKLSVAPSIAKIFN